jgi:peptidoglycan endopeptidase LytF
MAAFSAPWPSHAKGVSRPASASGTEQPMTRNYKVLPGDTLSKIARQFGTTAAKIQSANRLKNSRIKAGQSLTIPPLPAPAASPEPAASSRPAMPEKPAPGPENQAGPKAAAASGTGAAARTYKVRKGDTLFQIAKTHGTTPEELQAANGLKGSRLAIGQTLRLPSAPDEDTYAVVPYAPKAGTSPGRAHAPADTPMMPAGQAEAPAGQAEAPAGQAEAPAKQAEAPAGQAEAPAKQAEAPAKLAEAPAKLAEAPAKLAEAESRAAVPGPAAAHKPETVQTYTVRKGDTLFQIARRHDTTLKELQAANRLKGSRLAVGQTLVIPAVQAAAKARPAQPALKNPAALDFSAYVPGESAAEAEEEAGEEAEDLPVRLRLLEAGFRMLGIRYRYGGTSEKTGLDCSALVRNLFSKFNLQLPRSSREQYQQGEKVDRKDLREGDLVFFSSGGKTPNHVGIYIGDNKFLHAARKAKKVVISDLTKLWYEKRYLGARRIMDLWWEEAGEETGEEPQSANR